MTKEKPMVVEFNRYFRQRHNKTNEILSDSGVTVIVTLDYVKRTFTAKWAICNGDNFNKVTGLQYAQACSMPIIGSLPAEPGEKLINMMLDQIQIMMDDEVSMQDKLTKRNLTMLQHNLMLTPSAR